MRFPVQVVSHSIHYFFLTPYNKFDNEKYEQSLIVKSEIKKPMVPKNVLSLQTLIKSNISTIRFLRLREAIFVVFIECNLPGSMFFSASNSTEFVKLFIIPA